MLNRFSSRKTDLGKTFLVERLKGAVAYDRIAGYFSSSCLEIAGEAVENVSGTVRVICNSGITAEDVKIAGLAGHRQKIEWTELRPEKRFVSAAECARLQRLYDLLKSGKMVIRVVPDEVYGLLHGKAGVITYADGRRTSFIGSMNETKSALSSNYEIVWEDDDAASADWVQKEFDFFWNNPAAVPLAEEVVEDVRRIAKRHPLQPPRGDAQMWEIVRNPIPLCDDHEIASLRNKLDLVDETSVLSQRAFEHLPRPVQGDIRELYQEDGFVSRFNPYVRTIVRRTRDYLENTVNPETGLPYLEKIEVDLYGEKSEESLPLQGYLAVAYRIAESFCEMLSKRVYTRVDDETHHTYGCDMRFYCGCK